MKKMRLKYSVYALLLFIIFQLMGCNQSPVRNPFAGRQEPKLGELPQIAKETEVTVAQNIWSTHTLTKQERFSKLLPFISHSTIYAADHAGKVVALKKKSGEKIWSSNTGKKFTAGPTIVNDKLLLTTSDAKVVAVSAQDGHFLWEKKVSSEVLAAPSGAQGIVLVHAMDGSVIALSEKTGEVLWHVDQTAPALTLRFSSAPVIVGNTALVGFASGKLVALNLNSGLVVWERVISQPRGRSELQRMVDISADPIVMDNTIYVITYQGKLAAVNITSGDLLWEKEVSSYQNMGHDNQYLYVTDNSHHLWAINRENGATMWKQDSLAERYITGPAVVNGMVVVGDRGGYLHFVSRQNGHLLNQFSVSGKLYQNPLGMGKTLLVSSHTGKIAALNCAIGDNT